MPEIKDLGLERIVQQVRELRGVKVGVLATAPDYPDGTSVVDVAVWNEYGTERAPARPFVGTTVRQAGGEMRALVDHTVGLMIDGRTDAKGVDDTVGRAWADNMKKVITGFNNPPNAPATVLDKGRNDPLVDTGHLRDVINYERL